MYNPSYPLNYFEISNKNYKHCTVNELIDELKKYDGNMKVSRDYEGCKREVSIGDFFIDENENELIISVD